MSKIITGNPGVGKHTVAKIITKKLGLDLADINKIVVQEKLYEKHNGVLDVDVRTLKKILNGKITKNTLVVGHLAPYIVPSNQVEFAVVLRKNPYKLLPIYKKRHYTNQKSMENLGSEILGITMYDTTKEFGHKKTCQIDTTSRSINTIVKKIERLFVKGICIRDEVDWLGLISKKNDLALFFPTNFK